VDRGALPDRSRERRRQIETADGGGAASTVRCASARGHVPQPQRAVDIRRPELQAYPRAHLAAHLYLRREVVSGRGQRRDRQNRRRPSMELDQDCAAGPRRPGGAVFPELVGPFGCHQTPDFLSHRATAPTPASTRPDEETSVHHSAPDSSAANDASTSRFARASSSGNAGSIGRGSAACLSWVTRCSACFISSIERGEPQCVHAAAVVRSMGPPQLEQLTVWTFCRKSAICCADRGRMKFFSRRKSKNVM